MSRFMDNQLGCFAAVFSVPLDREVWGVDKASLKGDSVVFVSRFVDIILYLI